MIKGILSLKILLFLLLSIFLFYPFKAFANEKCDNLFIYRQDVLTQVSKKKQIDPKTEPLVMFEQKGSHPTFVDRHFAKQILNNIEKEIKEYNPIAQVSSYEYTETILISQKELEEYIPRLKHVIEESSSSAFISTLLEYRETISKKRIPHISLEYVENLFSKDIDINHPNYAYFLELRDKPQILEKGIYTENITTNETETPSNPSETVSKGTQSSGSTDVNFVLTILPVRFVYVENNEIIKIWNNVEKDDTQYVVKFLDQNEKEITPSENLYSQYFNIIEELDVFKHGTIYDENMRISKKADNDNIYIQVNENSLEKEEIYTMI